MMPRTQAMQKRRSATKALDSFVNFLLACLPLIGFLLFMLIPMVLGFGMSFMQLYTPVFSDGVFCGFDNYARLLWGEDAAMFYRAFLNTIIFWLNVPVSMALGLGISYLLNREIVAKKFFRTVFFIPYVCSIVACTLMFKMMYETNFGIFNTMLSAFGISNIEWITSGSPIPISSSGRRCSCSRGGTSGSASFCSRRRYRVRETGTVASGRALRTMGLLLPPLRSDFMPVELHLEAEPEKA